MRLLGSSKQILCVTHSAQVAASSDEQFKISKLERDGRTFTEVRRLDGEEREKEIARILGGLSVTDASLRSAKELLDKEKITKELEYVESFGSIQA